MSNDDGHRSDGQQGRPPQPGQGQQPRQQYGQGQQPPQQYGQGQGRPPQYGQGQPPRQPQQPYGQGAPEQSAQGPSTYGHQTGYGGSFGESWREQEFGHGQSRYYGDLGQQPPAGGPPQAYGTPVEHGSPPSGPIGQARPGGRRTALLLAGTVAAVAVLGGGGYALYRGVGDDGGTPAGRQASTTAPASTTTSTPASFGTTAPSGGGSTQVPALVPGWRVSVSKKDKAAFDVPPGTFADKNGATVPAWKISGEATRYAGYGDPSSKDVPTAIGHQPTYFRESFCSSAGKAPSDRGMVIYQTSGDRDPTDIAADATTTWADAVGYDDDTKTSAKYTPGTLGQVAVNGGRTQAVRSRTTIPIAQPDAKKCQAPKVELVVTSFTTGTSTATIVALRDLGVPDQVPDDVWTKVIDSARPVP